MATLDPKEWAAKCRRLASTLDDQLAIKVMTDLARELEAAADLSDGAAPPELPAPSAPAPEKLCRPD